MTSTSTSGSRPPMPASCEPLAEATGTSPSLAARQALVEALDNALREELVSQMESVHEELATLKAAQTSAHEELKIFRTEFLTALRRAGG